MEKFDNFPIEEDNWENVDINKYDEQQWIHGSTRIGRNNHQINLDVNNKKFANKFLFLMVISILYMVFTISTIIFGYDIPYYTYMVFLLFYSFFLFVPNILPKSKLGIWLDKKTII